MTVRLSRCSGLGNSLTTERKCHAERGRWVAADYVGPDPQPVRGEVGVADPGLQIAHEWIPGRNDWSRRREIKEITIGHEDLRPEEIVALRQNDRAGERDIDLHLLTHRWTFAASVDIVRKLIDTVHHG